MLRSLNRMHEVIPGAYVEGKVLLDGEDIYGSDVDPVNVRRTIGMVFQRPNPFPTMSIYDNVIAGLRLERGKGVPKQSRSDYDEVVETSLRGANLWDEVKDRLGRPGLGPLRRPAAAAVHRPGHRRGAAGRAHGRAVLGARPDLHPGHRGPHRGTQEPSTRS